LVIFIKSHPNLSQRTGEIMDKIVKSPFDRNLKTHKLSGRLNYCFASNINYEYRVVFLITDETITFIDIGSHDEVY